MKTYVGSDGKLHFINSAGADTVLPFSDIKNGSFAISGSGAYNIDLGGKPKFVAIVARTDASIESIVSIYSSTFGHSFDALHEDQGYLTVTDTGFKWNHLYNWGTGTAYYVYSMTEDTICR